MAEILHTSVGKRLTRAEYEASGSHTISDTDALEIVRTATQVVAANDSSALSKLQNDQLGTGTADNNACVYGC